MNLYDLSKEFENCIDYETGEIDTAKFEALNTEFEKKNEYLIKHIKGTIAEAKAIKEEEDKLAKRRKSLEREVDFWSEYLKGTMLIRGISKYNFPFGVVSFRKSTTVETDNDKDFVNWAKDNKLNDLIRITVTEEPNKAAIAKAIDGGQKIEHAKIVEHNNIQIK